MRPTSASLLALAASVCACGSTGRVVHAPATTGPPPASAESSDRAVPVACGKPWSVDVIGGGGRVVVACPGDVQRV
ncbi:MAG TPA: hypothetical protein VKU41_18895, partial [Polyangiaceae bacterium]|nr:hypothetical protein [Polyangiaceae bacterium]